MDECRSPTTGNLIFLKDINENFILLLSVNVCYIENLTSMSREYFLAHTRSQLRQHRDVKREKTRHANIKRCRCLKGNAMESARTKYSYKFSGCPHRWKDGFRWFEFSTERIMNGSESMWFSGDVR